MYPCSTALPCLLCVSLTTHPLTQPAAPTTQQYPLCVLCLQVSQLMSADRSKLIARSQLPVQLAPRPLGQPAAPDTSNNNNNNQDEAGAGAAGGSGEARARDPETYDEGDFYSQLLNELLESGEDEGVGCCVLLWGVAGGGVFFSSARVVKHCVSLQAGSLGPAGQSIQQSRLEAHHRVPALTCGCCPVCLALVFPLLTCSQTRSPCWQCARPAGCCAPRQAPKAG